MENGPSDFIPIIIDSYGGSVYGVLGMVDLMLSSNKTILTYVQSKAMSAGLILAAFGTKGFRFAGPLSNLMLHQAGGWSVDTVAGMKNSIEHLEALNKHTYEKLAEHCGQSKSYFLDLIDEKKNLDIFLTSKQALDHKLIDRIGVPTIKVRRQTQYSLE